MAEVNRVQIIEGHANFINLNMHEVYNFKTTKVCYKSVRKYKYPIYNQDRSQIQLS